MAGFSDEFIQGMASDDDRSRRLGDVGANSPKLWRWGCPGDAPHLLVMLYARPGGLVAWAEAVKGHSWDTALSPVTVLTTAAETRSASGLSREPFGFVDGISQPEIDWQLERQSD